MVQNVSDSLAREMHSELVGNILPFWVHQIDDENGGFYGQVENDGRVDARADKGIVQQARFLWTYSAAASFLREPRHLGAAEVAYRFIRDALYDRRHGGFHWICDYRGKPQASSKVIYGQAFTIYALAEYARAGGPGEALELALETYRLIEKVAHDARHGGYFEAAAPDWSASVVSALGAEDLACAKSMNTNLHMLEALTTLHEATGDAGIGDSLRALLPVHLDRILAPSHHLGLFFDADWSRLDSIVSYGHDIEASWLLTEAAGSVGEKTLADRVRGRSLLMAGETARVLDENAGSLPNEMKKGLLDTDRIWWVQAEGIVGMVNAWQLSGDASFLRRAERLWGFVKGAIVDGAHGDWFWGAQYPAGTPMQGQYKGGLWKASYHNGRACMEIMRRLAGGVGGRGESA